MLIIMTITLIVRFYFFHILGPATAPDSAYYLNYKPDIFKLQVDILRTPVYPYFIRIIRALFGKENLINNIVYAQEVLSLISAVFFYLVVNRYFNNRWVKIISTLIFTLSPGIFNFNKCILTESLSISYIVFFIYLVIRYISKPSPLFSFIIGVTIFMGIMLRPIFMYLILFFLIFSVGAYIINRNRRLFGASLASCLMCFFALQFYIHLNKVNNQCNSISIVSTVNLLDNVINQNLYHGGSDAEMISTIDSNKVDSENVFNEHAQLAIVKKYPYSRINHFVNSCISRQPLQYLGGVMVRISHQLGAPITTISAQQRYQSLDKFTLHIFDFLILYQVILILLFDLFFLVYVTIKYKPVLWFNWFLNLSVCALLAINFIFAPAEFQRLFVVAIPCLILIVFKYLDILIATFDTQKFINYFRTVKS